jgi:hypothetical protein
MREEVLRAKARADGVHPRRRREDVVSHARHRLYRATASELFVLDPYDERSPVSMESWMQIRTTSG